MSIIFRNLVKKHYRELGKILRKAGIAAEQDKYIGNAELSAFIFSLLITAFCLLVFLKEGWPLAILLLLFVFLFTVILLAILHIPKLIINNRRIEVESDILYSTRYLILKLESGSPLLNALIDVSKLHTNSSKFFQEIVSDIYLGTSVEDAIDNAVKYSPSKAFTKIFNEIKNSLKTGADIEKSLKATLKDMTRQHVVEIKAYGKKLSPASMFYMIIGTIAPSIGTALLVVASGFLPGVISKIDFRVFAFLFFVVVAIQGFFILFFKAMKPEVMA
ncbi:type II secretion system F family protein [Candidatus Woesearchaeota archaeon]|nr:type II secretion system F family protein [Candidatus Woesearchaeota archaeon]